VPRTFVNRVVSWDRNCCARVDLLFARARGGERPRALGMTDNGSGATALGSTASVSARHGREDARSSAARPGAASSRFLDKKPAVE